MPDPSAFGDDAKKGRNELLYGGDANTAMYNALLDSGRNPLRANPFTQMLMRAGSGLQLASRMNNMGMNADEVAAAGGGGELTRNAMVGALKGGNVFDTLRNAAGQVPGTLDKVTAIQDAIANHTMDASQANPFAELLMNAFGDPGHMQSSMSSLMSPVLGGELGSAYKNQMGDIANAGMRSYAGDVENGTDADSNFWNYVFRNTKRGATPNEDTNRGAAPNMIGPSQPR